MAVSAPPDHPSPTVTTEQDRFEALIEEARQRARRRRQIFGAVAVGIAAVVAATMAINASDTAYSEPSALDNPAAAAPTAPTGELVASMLTREVTAHRNLWLYLYADGRLISAGGEHDGWLERRLTAEAVAGLQDEFLASGLFDPDRPPPGSEGPGGPNIQARIGDRQVNVTRAEGQRLDTRVRPARRASGDPRVLASSDSVATTRSHGLLPDALRSLRPQPRCHEPTCSPSSRLTQPQYSRPPASHRGTTSCLGSTRPVTNAKATTATVSTWYENKHNIWPHRSTTTSTSRRVAAASFYASTRLAPPRSGCASSRYCRMERPSVPATGERAETSLTGECNTSDSRRQEARVCDHPVRSRTESMGRTTQPAVSSHNAR